MSQNKNYDPAQKLWATTKHYEPPQSLNHHKNMKHYKIVNHHKKHKQNTKLMSTNVAKPHSNNKQSNKLWTTTKTINHHQNYAPSQIVWTINTVMSHHKIIPHHKVMNLTKLRTFPTMNHHENYESPQDLVLVHALFDGSLFLRWFIVFVEILSNFFDSSWFLMRFMILWPSIASWRFKMFMIAAQ